MKNILRIALISTALVSMAGAAQAQTNQRHYASSASINGNVTSYEATSPSDNSAEPVLADGNALAIPLGTRYTAIADAPSDSETNTPTVNVAFALSGTVNRDCSFYAGNTNNARAIDFGVIGVRTGNNENVNSAFEMVGQAEANIDTLTAGCNTNNVVEINKNDIRGLVNANPGGYDTDEFQANIPYQVTASWTGVALNAQTTGSSQSLLVPTTGNAGSLSQGAWRSRMDIDIVAPAVTNKGLVAGAYTGTTTLTLRAL